MNTPEEFDQTLRSYVKRRPFFPFQVILKDGQALTIGTPNVAFGGGSAGFIDDEDGLVSFQWKNVQEFRFCQPEKVS